MSFNDVCKECGTAILRPRGLCKTISKPVAKKRKPRKTPTVLHLKEARAKIKTDMIALVPGVSRAKAETVVNAYEQSMARLVGASSTGLARVVCKGKPIGQELGVAIWRALH